MASKSYFAANGTFRLLLLYLAGSIAIFASVVLAHGATPVTLALPAADTIVSMLGSFNDARQNADPPAASPIASLSYSNEAETSAASFAQRCAFDPAQAEPLAQHSSSNDRTITYNGQPNTVLGENLYWAWQEGTSCAENSGQQALLDSVPAWNTEKSNYQVGCDQTNAQNTVGHYSQNIWDGTTGVGCAAECCDVSNSDGVHYAVQLVVCQFGPAGNINGYDLAYTPACAPTCRAGEPNLYTNRPSCSATRRWLNTTVNFTPTTATSTNTIFMTSTTNTTTTTPNRTMCPSKVLRGAIGRRWVRDERSGSCYMFVDVRRLGNTGYVPYTDVLRLSSFSTEYGSSHEVIVFSAKENARLFQIIKAVASGVDGFASAVGETAPSFFKLGLEYSSDAGDWKWTQASASGPAFRCFGATSTGQCLMSPLVHQTNRDCTYYGTSGGSKSGMYWKTESCDNYRSLAGYVIIAEVQISEANEDGSVEPAIDIKRNSVRKRNRLPKFRSLHNTNNEEYAMVDSGLTVPALDERAELVQNVEKQEHHSMADFGLITETAVDEPLKL